MPLFTRKESVPLDARDKALREEMARLESELHRLANETPKPVRTKAARPSPPKAVNAFAAPLPRASATTAPADAGRFNERGVRKFDLLAFIHNLGENLTGPAGNNPAMAKMLAAGGIHGLRPLRKERRVARNRFLFLFFTLLLILWGVAYTYIRQR